MKIRFSYSSVALYVCGRSVVSVDNILGDAKFLHKYLTFLTSQARCILLMSITISSLGPASSAVGTWERSFLFVKPDVIFDTANFAEGFLTTWIFADPNLIHPVCSFIPFIVYYIIREITLLIFVWKVFLFNNFARCCQRFFKI